MKYFWPSNLFAGFGFVVSEWSRNDAKGRTFLLLIFTPVTICMVALLYNFAIFIFEFISRLLGWFLLTALFGGGGIFLYEKLRESKVFSSQSTPHRTTASSYDATADVSDSTRRSKTVNTPRGDEESGEKENKRKKLFN